MIEIDIHNADTLESFVLSIKKTLKSRSSAISSTRQSSQKQWSHGGAEKPPN